MRRPGDEVLHGGVGDDFAPADDDDMIDDVLELAHEVARDEDGPSLGCERAKKPAHPDDPFGIDPVERLVHHHDRRVAEHRGRDAEPLAHPERVAAGLAFGGARKADHVDDFVDASGADALGLGHPEQVIAPRPARLEGVGVEEGSDDG